MGKFKNKMDVLNREKFVEKLFGLTQQISNNKKSTSFAIDGSWGIGSNYHAVDTVYIYYVFWIGYDRKLDYRIYGTK